MKTTLARGVVAIAVAALAGGALIACERGSPVATPTTSTQPSSSPPPSVTATPTPSATPTVAPTTTPPRPTPSKTPPRTTTPPPPTSAPPFPPGLAGKDLTLVPTSKRVVVLTFDAGANANGVASILATLSKEHVTATFFLTGNFVDHFPAATQSIAQAGHRLGNHSVTHPHFPTLTATQLRTEVLGAEQRIRTATGSSPKPFFRFPYGDRTSATIASVNKLGYVAVRWTVDTLGWQGTSGGRSVSSVTQRVLAAAQPGEIVLMHVGSHPTDHSTLDADALPGIIAGLRARGYSFVTLNALLGATG